MHLGTIVFAALVFVSCGGDSGIEPSQVAPPRPVASADVTPTASTSPERIYPDPTVPRPDVAVSEILDDPAMDDVADIIHDGIDPHEFDIYVDAESRFIDDLDRDIAGAGFRAEPFGVVIVTPSTTHLVATGMVRNPDGVEVAAGLLDHRTRAGTVEVIGQSVTVLAECGATPPVLVRDDDPPTQPVVTVECGSQIRLRVDMTSDPATVTPVPT
jgi:hypothetical protein